jgi:hypothetical protein
MIFPALELKYYFGKLSGFISEFSFYRMTDTQK